MIQNWYVVRCGQDGHAEVEGEIEVAGKRLVFGLRITNWGDAFGDGSLGADDVWERILAAYLNSLEGAPNHPTPTYEQADALTVPA